MLSLFWVATTKHSRPGNGRSVVLYATGDELAAGKVEQNLGIIYWRRERYAEAVRLLQLARARFERLDDGLQLTQMDNNLAGVLALQYRFAEATTHYEQALTRADRSGLEVTRAEVAVNLGCLALARGDYGRALLELEDARRRYSRLDLPHKLANAEKELADAYLELNLLPEAADLYERVISHVRAARHAGRAGLGLGPTTAVPCSCWAA